MDFADWSSPTEPAVSVDLGSSGALDWILSRYGGANPTVLRAVLSQAYVAGASGAVLEYRYIDADWRSEHANFYAGTFRRYPSVAHRLHFFLEPIPDSALVGDGPAGFADFGYLGYVVLRPVPAAPVGRAFLVPPADVADMLTCQSLDTVNLLGEQLEVRGTAFMAQDAMLLRCAHATLWMSAYHHHRRFSGRRWLPAEIADAAPGEIGQGRTVPSLGLDLYQMSTASEALGMPPVVYDMSAKPPGESLQRLACRYLNSGLPVIVASPGHAFVLIGYRRVNAGQPDEMLVFLRHDDEAGPYQVVENFVDDFHGPWEYLLVPLPAKVYMPGEDAEAIGTEHLKSSIAEDPSPEAQDLLARIERKEVTFRSTVMPSNSFKLGLADRGMPEPLASVFRRVHLSRWVWVVEAVEKEARRANRPCVLADAVIDATDHQRDMRVLLIRTPTRLHQWQPDRDRTLTRSNLTPVGPLPSVGLARS